MGGTFGKISEGHDGKRHPAAFRLHARAPSRNLADRIVVDVEGLADAASYIDEFVDIESGAASGTLTPGGQFNVASHKSEIAGDDVEAGVRFAPADAPPQQVKASGHLAENAASKLTGVIPPSAQIVTMAREQF
ncbi:MAG: DUF4469 domain-containing protein [Treponema sp.]|nr:DUF4469 domain-containing protein [Treponema sp.]